jgi:hypothetical protein
VSAELDDYPDQWAPPRLRTTGEPVLLGKPATVRDEERLDPFRYKCPSCGGWLLFDAEEQGEEPGTAYGAWVHRHTGTAECFTVEDVLGPRP